MASYPIVFTTSGSLSVEDDASYWYICNVPYGLTLLDVDLAIKIPSVGAIIMIDIEKSSNGTSWTSIFDGGFLSGNHDGGDDENTLTDSSASFTDSLEGLIIENTSDGSSGSISAVHSSTNLSVTLSGGDNDWDTNDAYSIALAGGIEPGEYIGVGGTLTDTEIEEGDLLRLDVEQCGSTVKGSDLTVSLRVRQ